MIITCPSCDKKFNVDASLIPKEGRNLQCGFCDHKWFYTFPKKIVNDDVLELEGIDTLKEKIQIMMKELFQKILYRMIKMKLMSLISQ